MTALVIIFTSSIFAIVWTRALTESGNIFDWWPAMAIKISKNPKWLSIAYGCSKCMSGQLAFWSAVMMHSSFDHWLTIVLCPIFAIFTTLILTKILDS